ncbi:MAG: response regulator, partial [Candidatus Latescibacteria bacterium]|nr:response regulator [Candidatus Latescibacterota bacterium]
MHSFPSGESAMTFIETHAVGIAFVDIKLTDSGVFRRSYVSGLNVLKAIKKRSPGAKAILISGFGTAQMAQEALLDLGASYYLGKPFSANEILHLVNWSIAHHLGLDIAQLVMNEFDPEPEIEGSESVLVVDDDEAVAEGIALAIRKFGYRATVAHGGSEALLKINTERFDAVLLDISMPGINGFEVLRNIPAHNQSVVVMLTAMDDEETAQKATELGAVGFLTKPCDLSLLQLTLEF